MNDQTHPRIDSVNSATARVRDPDSSDDQAIDRETEMIEADIARTRADMSRTIDAIQQRLDPEVLKEKVREATIGRAEIAIEEAVEDVRYTAKGVGLDMFETIRQNPIPAALAGFGLAWLFAKSSSNTADWRMRDPRFDRNRGFDQRRSFREPPRYRETLVYPSNYPDDMDYGRGGDQGIGGDIRSRVDDMADDARHQARDVLRQAQNIGDQVRDQAAQVGDQVRDQTEQFSNQARYRTQMARSGFEQWFDENPLAVGALAVGAGMMLGLMVPSTPQEDELLGDVRQDVMQRAQAVKDDAVERVQRVAEKVGATASEEITNAVNKDANPNQSSQSRQSQSSTTPSGMSSGAQAGSQPGTQSGAQSTNLSGTGRRQV